MASQNTAAQTASVTRRTLVQLGGAAAAAATVAGLTANRGLAYAAVDAAEADASTPSFLIKPEPITDVAETIDTDVLIIGGGVVGSAIAREMARNKLSIGVLEKNLDVCYETSGRNSGVVHGGFAYDPGTLKAACCVE